MPSSRHLRRVTLLLVGVSTGLVQFALDQRAPGAGLPLLGVSLVLGLGFHFLVRSKVAWSPTTVAGVLALSGLPLLWDIVSRSFFYLGMPYEAQLAYVLQNAMIALAAAPGLPQTTNHAVLASFFLVVFGYLLAAGPWSVVLLVVYALLGTWWLLAAYWERLGGRFADSSESAVPVRPAATALVALALIVALLLPLVDESSVTTALRGFFPSSGGTDQADPFAYGGVGDGDQMVAAKEEASSFGPVDSDLFLESKMPSLYDAFNEFSEAKPEKKKRLRRAIPLAPSMMQVNHEKKGTTQQATREFSTVRQRAPRLRNLDDRSSAALLLVSGRVPLHLGLETYDQWDGRSLISGQPAESAGMKLREADESGRRWLDLAITHPREVFPAVGSAQVRVLNLKTDRVPLPAGATGVTMKGLHDASMFTFSSDGSLAMDVQLVPQLTIFEFRSALRDRYADPPLARTELSEDSGPIARLAADWTRGVPAGWPQVEAIVGRLRSDYVHDREAMAPAEAEDAVEHFLLESKRGPDYLFAASTAMLLRSLGYDTRVRSGFYVNPDRYERGSRLTRVLVEDAHFWTEVRSQRGLRFRSDGEVLSGVWLTVESTPGYGVLYAPSSLLTHAVQSAIACFKAVVANPVTSSLCLLGLGLVVAVRRRILDVLLIGWWSIRSLTVEGGDLARVTLRHVEWRAWAHCQSRPTGTPVGRWEALATQDDFITLVGWALYGAGSASPLPSRSARDACRRAIRTPFNTATPRSEPSTSGDAL